MEYTKILEKTKAWGAAKHPESNNYRHAAFANSVAYFVTGASGGYGGPSIREHCCSWALAGDGYNIATETNIGTLTVQYPDGRLPRAGKWNFEQACQFCELICYGQLPAIASRILEQEHCFDDDPDDLAELRGK